MKERAEHEHDPTHDAQVIQHRDQGGHENDGWQHARGEDETARAEYLEHFRLHETAEKELYAGIAIIEHAVDARSHAGKHGLAERNEKDESANTDLGDERG